MADVRYLLKNERAARRIQHKYASYSPTGTLLCLACHLQLKSESLWEGHLKSAGHIMRAQKSREGESEQISKPKASNDGNNKKRKASDDDEPVPDTIRKRSRATNGLPEGFFDPGVEQLDHLSETATTQPPTGIQIPSRPATPLKPTPEIAKLTATVDEAEWAAFEADIAAAEVPSSNDAVISAPAISAAELTAQSLEESHAQRKQREEAELEGDKEDVANKLQDEFEEMEGLEQRVRRMREKREALRKREAIIETPPEPTKAEDAEEYDEDDEEDEEDEDDNWDGFRIK